MPQEKQMNLKRSMSSIIHSVFATEAECARSIGWPRQRLNRIVNGQKEPTVTELAEISMATQRHQSEIADIFLAFWSPNG